MGLNTSRRKSISTGDNIGIQYEKYINQILKQRRLQSKAFVSAGASDYVDGFFWYNKRRYPFEIKKDLSADFAQVELNWNKEKGFFYSKRSKNYEFISVLKNERFLDKINSKWTNTPRKFTRKYITTDDRYWDLDHFPDIKRNIDAYLIEQFYNYKKPPINYIQIGTRGFYYLTIDVAGLGVTRLKGIGILRARLKTRDLSKNRYGFLVAIKLRKVESSTHDIEEKEGRIFPF